MSTNNKIQEPEVNVEEALSKTEKFFETYKNHIVYGSIAIVAVVAALFVSNRIDKIDKSINLTNEIKTKANSFIKGCGDFVKGMKGWKQWT